MKLRIPWEYGDAGSCPSGWTPVGTVEFCESVLGISVKPEFYPTFLSSHLHRKIEVLNTDREETVSNVFVKSASKYKEFDAYPVWDATNIGPGEFYLSEIVDFCNEWRLYVANGEVVASGWYAGDESMEDFPPPPFHVDWPEDYCGSVDIGTLRSGQVALVECHHPYGCGWYGDDHVAYVDWLQKGWMYVLRSTQT